MPARTTRKDGFGGNALGEKEIFLTRLYLELQAFRNKTLGKGKEAIYASSFKIEAYVNLFSIIVDLVDENPDMDFGKLARDGDCLLETLYRQWMDYDDGAYMEMARFAVARMKPYMKEKNHAAVALKAA